MEHTAKIYVAGHAGMAGSALVRALGNRGYKNLLLRTSKELDLRDQRKTEGFFKAEKPEYVFLAAAHVGGIMANSQYPADFLYDNLCIEMNVIHAAQQAGVKKLLFLGTSCIYPKLAPQPLKEEYLLTGALEPTNEGYALAKIAGLRYCAYLMRQYGLDFISAMPPNLYGPNDNYHLENAHVLPALIRRFYEAKQAGARQVTVWGTGGALREFMYADDLADACLFLMDAYSEEETINIGTGQEVAIRELAYLIKEVAGYQGEIAFDASKPDGMPRKILDTSKMDALGWRCKTSLREGIQRSYEDFLQGPYRQSARLDGGCTI